MPRFGRSRDGTAIMVPRHAPAPGATFSNGNDVGCDARVYVDTRGRACSLRHGKISTTGATSLSRSSTLSRSAIFPRPLVVHPVPNVR